MPWVRCPPLAPTAVTRPGLLRGSFLGPGWKRETSLAAGGVPLPSCHRRWWLQETLSLLDFWVPRELPGPLWSVERAPCLPC